MLDLDATDDPLHGHQEGRFFHGYYDYCYLPLYIFAGDHLLAREAAAFPYRCLGGVPSRNSPGSSRWVRARWPRVRIVLRADGGFAREALMCQQAQKRTRIGVEKGPLWR